MGVGLLDAVPSAWADYKWSGHGTPSHLLVSTLRQQIRFGGTLPSSEILSQQPILEASAAQALDLEAPMRVPCLFHADDPLFASTTYGGLHAILVEVSAWAADCGAAFHCSADKTVYFGFEVDVSTGAKLSFAGVELTDVHLHRWLGVLWPDQLDFTCFLSSRIQIASAMASQLAGLGRTGSLSWLTLCELFDSKVDSQLDMGRWMFIMVPDSEDTVNKAYDRWARSFLGAEFWRNAAVCAHELGWLLSGFARVVLAVATQRAKWWADGGWHSQFFLKSNARGQGWAKRSAEVLSSFAIIDWPLWSSPCTTVADYRDYAKGVLMQSCKTKMAKHISMHSQRLPYNLLEPVIQHMPSVFRSLELPVSACCHVRHWCRLRCGLVTLRHLGRHVSAAVHQSCIFCGATTAHPLVHCMALCPRWSPHRDACNRVASCPSQETNQQLTIRLLSSSLPVQLLSLVIQWAAEIDSETQDFWNK